MSELYSSILASRVILRTQRRADPGEARWRRRALPHPPASSLPFIPPRAGGKVPVPTQGAGPARHDPGPRGNSPSVGAPQLLVGRPPWGFGPHTPQTAGESRHSAEPILQTAGRNGRPRACRGPPAPLLALEQTHPKAPRRSPPQPPMLCAVTSAVLGHLGVRPVP